MKRDTFHVYFSSSARVIGLYAHGSLLARGRSSARTTYFPVWPQLREIFFVGKLGLAPPKISLIYAPELNLTLHSILLLDKRLGNVHWRKLRSNGGHFGAYWGRGEAGDESFLILVGHLFAAN